MIATGVHLLLCVRTGLDAFLHVTPDPVDSMLVKNVQNQICITSLHSCSDLLPSEASYVLILYQRSICS